MDEETPAFRLVVVDDNVYVRLEDVIIALEECGVQTNFHELFQMADEQIATDDPRRLYFKDEL